MGNATLWLAIGCLLTCLVTPCARAALVVQDSDVVAGEFVFELNYGNFFSEFGAPLESSVGFSAQQFCCSATRYVLASQGQSFAQLLYRFDFSSTSFQPNAVEITDRVTLFTNTAFERTEATVEYSLDGVSFTTQRTTQTPNDGSLVIDDWDTYQIGLPSSLGSFYYRVTMVPQAIDPDGVFTHPQNQWTRTDGPGTGTTSYVARFFVGSVPEPGTGVLTLLGAVAAAAFPWVTR